MGQIDNRQLRWGIVLGAVTFGLMLISYNVGFDKGKEQLDDDESKEDILAEDVEINSREVYITVQNECDTFETKRDNVREYCLKYQEEESAFTVLERLAANDEAFTFEYDEFDFGVFVTGINGYQVEENVEFWAFYINDESSMVGSSEYIVSEGDELGFVVEEITM